MKIQVEVEIFPDDEFCNITKDHHPPKEVKQCGRIMDGECREFDEILNVKYGRYEKCPQCKEAYQKAQNEKLHDEEKQYAPEPINYNEVANG